MKQEELKKSDKIILAIYSLETRRKAGQKITVEDVAVKLWRTYPTEFCMKGYPQYPNADIQKYITKILDNNLITGGVSNYNITSKGTKYAETLANFKNKKKSPVESSMPPRHIPLEINRIINSRVFKYYLSVGVPEFVESDLFDFIGTSTRSLSSNDKNIFLARYNIITKDIIPFCEENRSKDKAFEKIIELWGELYQKFNSIIKKKI